MIEFLKRNKWAFLGWLTVSIILLTVAVALAATGIFAPFSIGIMAVLGFTAGFLVASAFAIPTIYSKEKAILKNNEEDNPVKIQSDDQAKNISHSNPTSDTKEQAVANQIQPYIIEKINRCISDETKKISLLSVANDLMPNPDGSLQFQKTIMDDNPYTRKEEQEKVQNTINSVKIFGDFLYDYLGVHIDESNKTTPWNTIQTYEITCMIPVEQVNYLSKQSKKNQPTQLELEKVIAELKQKLIIPENTLSQDSLNDFFSKLKVTQDASDQFTFSYQFLAKSSITNNHQARENKKYEEVQNIAHWINATYSQEIVTMHDYTDEKNGLISFELDFKPLSLELIQKPCEANIANEYYNAERKKEADEAEKLQNKEAEEARVIIRNTFIRDLPKSAEKQGILAVLNNLVAVNGSLRNFCQEGETVVRNIPIKNADQNEENFIKAMKDLFKMDANQIGSIPLPNQNGRIAVKRQDWHINISLTHCKKIVSGHEKPVQSSLFSAT